MLAFILFLVLVWVVIGIIGVAVHGLIWLTVIAAIFFLGTVLFGGSRVNHRKAHR